MNYFLTTTNSHVHSLIFRVRITFSYRDVQASLLVGCLVGWSLTSLFSTNTATSETKASLQLRFSLCCHKRELNGPHITLRAYVFALLQRPLTNYVSYWLFERCTHLDTIGFELIPNDVKADCSCQYSHKS